MLWSESGVGEIGARCFVISGMFSQKVVWVRLVQGVLSETGVGKIGARCFGQKVVWVRLVQGAL